MRVVRDPICKDWYHVQSRSRPEIDHIVDTRFQERPDQIPFETCTCEAYQINLYTMGQICPHITAVRNWRRQHEPMPIQSQQQQIKDRLAADARPDQQTTDR